MFAKVRRRRRSSATALGALGVIVALTAVVAGGAQAAKPGNSQNAKACQKGGWQNLVRSTDYSGFSSEEECTSYAAKGGTLVNPRALCKQQLAAAGLSEPANANFILGTPGDDDFAGQTTGGNDVICGFAGNDVAHGLRAGDIFLGGDGNDHVPVLEGGTFNGGDGNDSVFLLFDGTFNGGAGNDSVHELMGGTFNGGEGCDVRLLPHGGGTFNQGAPCP